jgi:hypothetical protein
MIRPDRRILLCLVVLFGLSGGAEASWIEGRTATIQALDKITARISTLRVPIDEPVGFGTLSVTVRRCAYHPPEETPEDAAYLEVVDNGHDRSKPPRPVFTGWMFASSPAVSAMEHPVYDLTLLSCKSA